MSLFRRGGIVLRNRSGQFVYFSLIATQSGTAVTGSSGFISGMGMSRGDV